MQYVWNSVEVEKATHLNSRNNKAHLDFGNIKDSKWRYITKKNILKGERGGWENDNSWDPVIWEIVGALWLISIF